MMRLERGCERRYFVDCLLRIWRRKSDGEAGRKAARRSAGDCGAAEDVGSIEGIVKASYETISGDVGRAPAMGRDRTLFAPSVRYISLSKSKTGEVRARTSDYQEYLDESDDFVVKHGFTEVELGGRSSDLEMSRRAEQL